MNVMIDQLPAGRYSVSFRTTWQAPYHGKSGDAHLILSTIDDMDEDVLARKIAEMLTEYSKEPATCQYIRIKSISRLA